MKKRIYVIVLAACLVLLVCSCGVSTSSESKQGKKVSISIGGWPSQNDSASYNTYQKLLARFTEQYPDIEITPDTWGFDLQTFLPKAASGQLPSLYITSYTEIKRIINSGYASDVTKYMHEYKFSDYLRDDILNLISSNDKIYAIPQDAYVMALFINLNMFEKAGLINSDGTPMIPKTWEELAGYAQKIKEATGKPGFIMPTMQNCGGWHFINMAWGYGANHEFMKNVDGKWKEAFNTNECANALQYVKDLRWKYNAIPENAFIDHSEMLKQFATNQAGMFLGTLPQNSLTDTHKMSKDKIAVASMPAGPAGKFSQMGGNLMVLKKGLSDDEISACFKWIKFAGQSPDISDETKASREEIYKLNSEKGRLIGVENFSMWKNTGDVAEVKKFESEMLKKYANVDTRMFEDFKNFNAVTILPEPPVNCQELYSLFDAAIQSVITDSNADPKSLLKKVANDFQVNYLDKAN